MSPGSIRLSWKKATLNLIHHRSISSVVARSGAIAASIVRRDESRSSRRVAGSNANRWTQAERALASALAIGGVGRPSAARPGGS